MSCKNTNRTVFAMNNCNIFVVELFDDKCNFISNHLFTAQNHRRKDAVYTRFSYMCTE